MLQEWQPRVETRSMRMTRTVQVLRIACDERDDCIERYHTADENNKTKIVALEDRVQKLEAENKHLMNENFKYATMWGHTKK